MSPGSIIRYLISLGLIALILSRVNFHAFWSKILHADLMLLWLSILAMLGQIYFLNWRWYELLNVERQQISFHTSSMMNLVSFFANILLISSVGGAVVKSTLAIRNGMPVRSTFFAAFMDRLMTFITLVIFMALSFPFISDNIFDLHTKKILLLIVSIVLAIVILFILVLRSKLLKNYFLTNRKYSRLITTLGSFTKNQKLMMHTTIQSLIAQALFILAVYFLALGSGFQGDTRQFLAMLPVLALISSLPISFGGWGVREGAFVYGLGLIGFPMEKALFLSLQVGLVTLLSPLIYALPYLFTKKYNLLSLLRQSKRVAV